VGNVLPESTLAQYPHDSKLPPDIKTPFATAVSRMTMFPWNASGFACFPPVTLIISFGLSMELRTLARIRGLMHGEVYVRAAILSP